MVNSLPNLAKCALANFFHQFVPEDVVWSSFSANFRIECWHEVNVFNFLYVLYLLFCHLVSKKLNYFLRLDSCSYGLQAWRLGKVINARLLYL